MWRQGAVLPHGAARPRLGRWHPLRPLRGTPGVAILTRTEAARGPAARAQPAEPGSGRATLTVLTDAGGLWGVRRSPTPRWRWSRHWGSPHPRLLSSWTQCSRTYMTLDRRKKKQNRNEPERRGKTRGELGRLQWPWGQSQLPHLVLLSEARGRALLPSSWSSEKSCRVPLPRPPLVPLQGHQSLVLPQLPLPWTAGSESRWWNSTAEVKKGNRSRTEARTQRPKLISLRKM